MVIGTIGYNLQNKQNMTMLTARTFSHILKFLLAKSQNVEYLGLKISIN